MLSQVIGPSPRRGSETAVHRDVHLHGAGRDRRRTHQRENVAHAGIAPFEVGPETKPTRASDGNCTSNCSSPPTSVPSDETNQRATAEMRIEQPAKADAADDRAEIEKARSHRRHAENILRVQHSHDERGERDEENERKHDPREQDRELRLVRREPGRENRE